MVKPAKKRKGDAAQVAHSVVQDFIKGSGKPIKAPGVPKPAKRK
jgi:hypothetical protein